jgi:cytochrome c-type biogenesis protein CcmE
MHPARKQRLGLILLLILGAALAVGFALKAFNENLMFFYSPSQIVAGEAPTNARVRVGGMVETGSVSRVPGELTVQFRLHDNSDTISVHFDGILPDLFREGQGIVALGSVNEQGVFIADEVLAKHDENYMPPEVAEAMGMPHPIKKDDL